MSDFLSVQIILYWLIVVDKLSSLAVLGLRFPKVVNFEGIEAVLKRCSVKKLLLLISQNSQENTCARVSF